MKYAKIDAYVGKEGVVQLPLSYEKPDPINDFGKTHFF